MNAILRKLMTAVGLVLFFAGLDAAMPPESQRTVRRTRRGEVADGAAMTSRQQVEGVRQFNRAMSDDASRRFQHRPRSPQRRRDTSRVSRERGHGGISPSRGGFHAQRQERERRKKHVDHQQHTHRSERLDEIVGNDPRTWSPAEQQPNFVDRLQPFVQLIENMQLYKTLDTQRYAYHVYEHSIITALVIHDWFKYNVNPWVTGLNDETKELLVLAGFLHNIGKIGNKRARYDIGRHDYFKTTEPFIDEYPGVVPGQDLSGDGFEMLVPAADGDVRSPEDLVYDTPLTVRTEEYVFDDQDIRQGLSGKNLTVEQINELVERIGNMLATYHPGGSVDLRSIAQGLNLDGQQLRSVAIMIREHVQRVKYKTVTVDNLAMGRALNMRQIFEGLGFTSEHRQKVAILVGMVPLVENLVKEYNQGGGNEQLFENFIQQLGELTYKTGYNQGMVNESLVKESLLLGAASVRARHLDGYRLPSDIYHNPLNDYSQFIEEYSFFNSRIWGTIAAVSKQPLSHGEPTESGQFDLFEQKGEQLKKDLLEYFAQKTVRTGNEYQIDKETSDQIDNRRAEIRAARVVTVGKYPRPHTGYNLRYSRHDASKQNRPNRDRVKRASRGVIPGRHNLPTDVVISQRAQSSRADRVTAEAIEEEADVEQVDEGSGLMQSESSEEAGK